MNKEQGATPKFPRGSVVTYFDRQDRLQRGEVLNIDAHWPGYSDAGTPPYFVYAVSHPSYRNNSMYIGEDKLTASSRGDRP